MVNFLNLILTCVLVVSGSHGQKPWLPETRTEEWWVQRHHDFVQNTQLNGEKIKILFIGSSSVEIWSSPSGGKELWDSKYAPLGSVNYGIGGDQTQHQLWRILNGEIENIEPKMIVQYIGSNNINNPDNSEIVKGIQANVFNFRQKLPRTKILIVGMLPRGDRQPTIDTFEKILSINKGIQDMVDNEYVFMTDFFWELANTMGEIKPELFMSDKLHLSKLGYEVWDRSWNQIFFEILNS